MTPEILDRLFANGAVILPDQELGDVVVRINPRASRFIARWTKGTVYFTVPPGANAEAVTSAWLTLRPKLIKRAPTVTFQIGQHLYLDGLTIELTSQSLRPEGVSIISALPVSKLQIGTSIDLADPNAQIFIDSVVKRVATNVAPKLLIPRAKELATRWGCKVASWSITYGTKTLGYCTRHKQISLSSKVVFLPAELRDYIICHELAHLEEMNHSSRFHALCDRYCQGREAELINKLNKYNWPILR